MNRRKTSKPFPVVKHTKTSLYRMVKANPLLLLDKTTKKVRPDIHKLGLPNSVLGDITLLASSSICDLNETQEINSTDLNKNKPNTLIKTFTETKFNNTIRNEATVQKQSCATKTKVQKRNLLKYRDKTSTESDNIHINENKTATFNPSMITFNSPTAYNRRSVKFTTPASNYKKLYNTKFGVNELQKKLNDWLSNEDKSICSYHHLKLFGTDDHNHIDHINNAIDDENKENLEPDPPIFSRSYEELNIYSSESEVKEDKTSEQDLSLIAHDALTDLHKLISDGYTKDQCEIWLKMIRRKCPDIDNDPEYWECKAAIEQLYGNAKYAEKCYQTANAKGVEINDVNDSLEQLFNKFSLLNINACFFTNENLTQTKTDLKPSILQFAVKQGNKDANFSTNENNLTQEKSDLKSSILQFAVKQDNTIRHNKEQNELKFVATPVRRSTRPSRSAYTKTPTIQLCSSLRELTPEMRANTTFKKNLALLDFD